MQPRISLCLIAKNEEANLPACLQSARDLVDEIIVVDTGSTDRTKEVAAEFGARVFDFTWCDSFAAARNESLRHATGAWIFWLDGDERLDDANRAKFRALRAGLNGECAAFVMKQRSAPHAAGGSPTEVDQVRLFRNHHAIRWSYRVHEQILPAVRQAGHAVRFTDIAIEHTGYQDPALQRQKTERNLRLLYQEYAEQPDDPFTLFNLGWALHELGQLDKSVPLLRRSLERCGPGDSIVRKLYVLLTHAHRRLGQSREALAICRAGRARCPDDTELMFVEGVLLLETGDPAGAVACLRQLLTIKPGAHFASLDVGLRGGKARHHLALAYQALGQTAEAEAEWQRALAEQPDFVPAWLGLGELYLAQGRWPELEAALAKVPADPAWEVETLLLRGRACLARREFPEARRWLEAALAKAPRALGPRVLLTHVLLQDGTDPAAAEKALREVLALDPRQAECWRNLAVLLRQQGRLAQALAACRSGRVPCPGDGPLLLQHGLYLAEAGEVREAETCLLHYLETQPAEGTEVARGRRCSARHQLALLCLRQRRAGEAESHWRAVRAEQPDHLGAQLGLAELCLEQQRDSELDELLAELAGRPEGDLETAVLRARRHLARRECTEARRLLEETVPRQPGAAWPWVVLSHVLLQEGQDRQAAEQVLRRILELDPHHAEARRNLAVLLRQQGHGPDGGDDRGGTDFQSIRGSPDGLKIRPTTPITVKCLRLAFACYSPLHFDIDSVYHQPLGGSESALCYLAEALAGRGHEVFLLNAGAAPGDSRGVHCLPLANATLDQLPPLDAFVVLNCAGRAQALRSVLTPKTRLVLWSGHAHDQPAIQALHDPADRQAYDGFALVSEWQRREYVRHFGLAPERTAVLRNGIAPAFEGLFPEDTSILAQKARPPVLVYTSTPYRGLDLLLEAFPRIRQAVPGTILKIFSSMKVYQIPESEEEARFGRLYEQGRALAGVEYRGSVAQPDLAAELRTAAVLAYPNTYPETSCIAVLEAMAAGCGIVTSDRAALPETTAGFAQLVATDGDRETYLNHFVEATVQVLSQEAGPEKEEVESQRRRQVTHVNQTGTWSTLAGQWVQWLGRLRTGARLV
jgi:tetratricopeptide (TPR) repeat protein/glycosyltransferase involved in cell wall biosynthesis